MLNLQPHHSYIHPLHGHQIVNIAAGEWQISNRPDVIFSTVLGSCIAACMYDPVLQLGGMNHFLLPGNAKTDDAHTTRYGLHKPCNSF